MVAVVDGCKRIFLTPLYLGAFIGQLVFADHLPFLDVALLALEHNALLKFVLAKASTTSYSGLGKVHDHEFVFMVLASIANSKVEPLLVALGVCVHLHVQPIFTARDSVGAKQIA